MYFKNILHINAIFILFGIQLKARNPYRLELYLKRSLFKFIDFKVEVLWILI